MKLEIFHHYSLKLDTTFLDSGESEQVARRCHVLISHKRFGKSRKKEEEEKVGKVTIYRLIS